MTETTDNSTVC